MKFKFTLVTLLAFATMLMLSLGSCEGPEGPAGPTGATGADGPTGPAGPAGADGQDGVDGTTNCVECHGNSQVITAKLFQWNASIHATGGNFERNSTSCAVCHTSQGFLERMAAGTTTTAEAIADPMPQNCYTCHNIHKTYTKDDWALTYTDPVDLWHPSGIQVDKAEANLCINCHQSRVASPFPDASDPAGTVTTTSSRWGPHHGPQGNLLAGVGGYEVGDGYESSLHTATFNLGCNQCHMADAYGTQAGGHTFDMTYVYHGHDVVNQAGCANCHTDEDALSTLLEDSQGAIETLLGELHTMLVDKGILNDASGLMNTGEWNNDLAGAYYNYKFIEEDRSHGIHNFKYAKKLLENSIAAIQ